jgi:drug/metabolite transporter (DMT)-like permease
MTVSMAGFTLSDAITKFLFDYMNMGELMLVRGIIATVLVAMLAWSRGAFDKPAALLHPLIALRVFGEAAATLTFFIGLAAMPLPNVSAIMQALPLAVTAGAAIVYAEPVGWRRWSAVAVGFLGVLLIVRPGTEGFSSASLWILACVFFCVVRDLATKRIPEDIPTLAISTLTAAAVTAIGAVMIIPLGGWRPIEPAHLGLIAIAAVLLLFGYQFIIMAMRRGDISFVAPFRYTALIWALFLGWLVFSVIPDRMTLTGSAIVVGSGLYMLWRERRRDNPIVAEATGPAMAPDGL